MKAEAEVHAARRVNAARSRGGSGCARLAARGSGATASSSATTAGTMKASRNSTAPASPPTSGADTTPAVCTEANVPIARPSSVSGVASATADSSSGLVNALAAPCRPRATRNAATEVVAATATDAIAYAMYAARIARATPTRSPNVPETTCSAANGTR